MASTPGGRFVRRGSPQLAKAVRAEGGSGTVTGCIRRIRQNIIRRLREQAGIVVGKEDVIMNDRRHGYCLRDWIEVVVVDQG